MKQIVLIVLTICLVSMPLSAQNLLVGNWTMADEELKFSFTQEGTFTIQFQFGALTGSYALVEGKSLDLFLAPDRTSHISMEVELNECLIEFVTNDRLKLQLPDESGRGFRPSAFNPDHEVVLIRG